MSDIKVNVDELKAAISELESRSKPNEKIKVRIDGSKFLLSCHDVDDNEIEAILYSNSNLGAHFRMTHRLMYMKEKK